MKRGQGISISVIIIAAIALIVLVILIAVFSGRLGSFGGELEECRGICVPASNCTAVAPEGDCPQEVEVYSIENLDWLSSSGKKVCCLITK